MYYIELWCLKRSTHVPTAVDLNKLQTVYMYLVFYYHQKIFFLTGIAAECSSVGSAMREFSPTVWEKQAEADIAVLFLGREKRRT